MKQFTSHVNLLLTKKRLEIMKKKNSLIKLFGLLSVVIPVTISLVIMFCTNTEYEPITLTFEELQANLPPTTYHDIELESEGATGLFHPLDERTGIYLGPDGKPYNGVRRAYIVENDSLWYTQTIIEGKVMQLAMNMYDSTGAFSHLSVSVPSLDEQGNRVTTYYSDSFTDTLVISDIHTESDSLTTYVIYQPNGQIAQEFQIIPEHGMDGLATIYDEHGAIKEQRLYDKGEIIETIK